MTKEEYRKKNIKLATFYFFILILIQAIGILVIVEFFLSNITMIIIIAILIGIVTPLVLAKVLVKIFS